MKNRIRKEQKFWNSFAHKYDNFIEKRANGTYIEMCNMIMEDVQGKDDMLEIATGTGIISIQASKHVSNIVATDLSAEMIKKAMIKAMNLNINNIEFEVQDVCNLKYANESYDSIVASNVLHLLYEPDLAIREMKRVLKKDSEIIIPTYCYGQNLKSNIVSRSMGIAGFKAINRWSIDGFQDYLQNNGLKIKKAKAIDDVIPLLYVVAKKI